MNIELNAQSSVKIVTDKIIYFDPFRLEKYDKADIIFITHSHYDHYSEEDLLKIKKDSTIIVVTSDLVNKAKELGFNSVIKVEPNKEYEVSGIRFRTIPAYNIDKNYHKREYNWVGYIVEIEEKKIYVAGDTDLTSEAKGVKCDIAFIPIGGTYTMNVDESVKLVKEIKPSKYVVPYHYKTIVGSAEDAIRFKEKLDIDVNLLMK